MNIILIDIGGTNIKYAISDMAGNLDQKGSVSTNAELGAEKVYSNVCEIIDYYIGDHNISGIAISTAGQVDAISGSIIYATKGIPGYTGFKLRDRLMEKYRIKVSVENDVNCAAIGEMWKGSIDSKSFLALTIGTGIGGAIVEDGKINRGISGSAGEIGHMTLVYGGKSCNCGHCGCFERYASAQALENSLDQFVDKITVEELFENVRDREKLSTELFQVWIGYLTDGLKSLVHIFNPSNILIGGGITKQGDLLKNAIVDSLMPKIMPSFRENLSLDLMTLENDANLYGALHWYMESELKIDDF